VKELCKVAPVVARESRVPELTREERMQRVLDLLDTRDGVHVSELADEFSVSEVTVRQDLAQLARDGLVARVRGGVRALQRGQSELAFDARLRLRAAEKRGMARAAAAMVADGESVALDSSTSAYYLALELHRKQELVVVTNGLLIAAALADSPGVNVLVTGGMLRLAAMSVVGDLAADVLRSTRIDKGFFGARGLSLERGLMDLNPEEVRLKQEMARACERVIGLFDRTKWNRTALLSFVPTEHVDAIVTDDGAPAELVEAWLAQGVDVVTAAPELAASGPERAPALRRGDGDDAEARSQSRASA
jgi:DeoR/GlpR family transcriptional regulator of sugar metabolism